MSRGSFAGGSFAEEEEEDEEEEEGAGWVSWVIGIGLGLGGREVGARVWNRWGGLS